MSDPFLAEVIMFGANFAPRSWAFCDGQTLPINSNQSLYSLLGTTYGGDGRTTFQLPDLRGRVPLGAGQGAGLGDIPLGQKTGTETNTLTQANLPVHSHTATGAMQCHSGTPGATLPVNNSYANEGRGTDKRYIATSDGSTFADDALSITVNNNGGGQPINNMQPFIAVNYIICMQGTFPSRN